LPLPWFTYGAIHFLESRLMPGFRVFEWGSGGSTTWWSERAKEVVACEHDHTWYRRVASSVGANVTVVERALGEAYSGEIDAHGEFDIVVIDGRERVACAVHAIGSLTPHGVIVWDNSDRTKYEPGLKLLTDHGFRSVEFFGLGPVLAEPWGTSIFYRPSNCLGL